MEGATGVTDGGGVGAGVRETGAMGAMGVMEEMGDMGDMVCLTGLVTGDMSAIFLGGVCAGRVGGTEGRVGA